MLMEYFHGTYIMGQLCASSLTVKRFLSSLSFPRLMHSWDDFAISMHVYTLLSIYWYLLVDFPNLQILSLSSTQITNKLLTRGVLNQCFKLSQLNLSRTRVSNKGIRCLHLDCLTLLNLAWTRVSSDCQLLLTGKLVEC